MLLTKEKKPDYSEPPMATKIASKKQVNDKEPIEPEKSKEVKQATPPQMSKPITTIQEQQSANTTSEQSQDTADEDNPALQPTPSHEKSSTSTDMENADTADTKPLPEIDDIRTKWREFINTMRGEGSAGNLDARLRSACEPVSIENGSLVLGFYHEFHKNYIEDPKYRFLVEKKLKEFFGKPYKLNCIVVERKKETSNKPETESRLVQAALERGAKKIDEQ